MSYYFPASILLPMNSMRACCILIILFLCTACSRESSNHDLRPPDHFRDEAARAIACIEGLSSVELSADVVFDTQAARCAEMTSYLQQIEAGREQDEIANAVKSLRLEAVLCHMEAKVSSGKFGQCLNEYDAKRDGLLKKVGK